jgi:hypothetical protein
MLLDTKHMLNSSNPDDRMLGSHLPIWLAIAGNVLVALCTYAIVGWNSAGGHAAARNTARFSFLWFVFAFALPGLVRFQDARPSETRAIQAFVSAHMVHYCAVLTMGYLAADSILRKRNTGSVLFVAIGFLLVLMLGLTSNPELARKYQRMHVILLYVVFLIFLVAYGKHPDHLLRFLLIPLLLALILRWSSRLTLYTAQDA